MVIKKQLLIDCNAVIDIHTTVPHTLHYIYVWNYGNNKLYYYLTTTYTVIIIYFLPIHLYSSITIYIMT